MLEFNWDNEAGKVIVEKTDLAKNQTYIDVYNTWMYFALQFLIPTLCLAIFSGLLVQEVRYYILYVYVVVSISNSVLSILTANFPVRIEKSKFV